MASPGDQAPAELTALLERMGVACAVVETKEQGKHVKALADFAEGAELFEEAPIVAWPIHASDGSLDPKTFCDGCMRAVASGSSVACDGCRDAVYCTVECQARAGPAHSFLCKKLAALRGFHAAEAASTSGAAPISAESVARCVATIAVRYLRLKAQNPDASPAELFVYAAHAFNRLLEPPVSATFEDADPAKWAGIVRRVMEPTLAANLPPSAVEGLLSDETIRTLLGELTINAQGLFVKPAEDSAAAPVHAAGVFTIQSCFNHSCCPNARVRCGTNSDITLEMIKPVKAGEEITISYLPPLVLELEPVAKRNERLKPYFFTCRCPKCTSELAAAAASRE
uniref:SET domain-containing protein n=1 Tax=Neobodo designis TaxID=312471 RepID=A0A7S1QP08_NEODS